MNIPFLPRVTLKMVVQELEKHGRSCKNSATPGHGLYVVFQLRPIHLNDMSCNTRHGHVWRCLQQKAAMVCFYPVQPIIIMVQNTFFFFLVYLKTNLQIYIFNYWLRLFLKYFLFLAFMIPRNSTGLLYQNRLLECERPCATCPLATVAMGPSEAVMIQEPLSISRVRADLSGTPFSFCIYTDLHVLFMILDVTQLLKMMTYLI